MDDKGIDTYFMIGQFFSGKFSTIEKYIINEMYCENLSIDEFIEYRITYLRDKKLKELLK